MWLFLFRLDKGRVRQPKFGQKDKRAPGVRVRDDPGQANSNGTRASRREPSAMESKKDAFRKYLEGAGVIDSITKGTLKRGGGRSGFSERRRGRHPRAGIFPRRSEAPRARILARRPPCVPTRSHADDNARHATPRRVHPTRRRRRAALVTLYEEPDKPVSGIE